MIRRLVVTLWLGWIVASAPPEAAAAGVFYVDRNSSSCSNSGPGTSTSPYCTISAAVAARNGAGTTINVRPGNYAEEVTLPASGASGNPFVIQALGSGVVVDGSDDFSATSKWTLHSGNVWRAASVTWSPDQVFADGARLAPSSASVGSLPSRTFRYVSGSGLYVNAGGGNPGTHQARVGRRSHGFRLSGRSWVTISGFTVTRTEDRSVYLSSGSNNCVLSNNTVTFSRRHGISVSESQGVTVASNRVCDNQDHGISFTSGSAGCTVQDNESCRNADPSERRANGIYLNHAPSNRLQRNRAHDNQDTGIQINSSSNNNISVGNISWNNGDHGYDHLNSTGTMHRNDVAYGNFKDGFSIEGSATGTSVFNCIGVNNGLTQDEYNLWVDSGSSSGFTSNYNLFWNSTSQKPVKYISTSYSTVSAYSAATGKDAQSVQQNPKFVNPAAGDFHLLSGSPAIDNANSSVSNWPVTDSEGRSPVDDPATPNTGVGPVPYADRGPLEFVSGGNAPPAVAAPATASGAEASVISVSVTASDPDGEAIASLTADRSQLPTGHNAVFSVGAGNTSGTLTWTPTHADARPGPYNVTFTASNSLSGSASTAITVTNVDRAPVVGAPAAVSIRQESTLTVPVTASDPDGEAIASLTADLSALPAGHNAVFTVGAGNTSGTLTWTPTSAHVRATPYNVIFQASNALSGTRTTAITVTNTDQAPVVAAPAAASGTEGSVISVSVTASDPDGDAIASLLANLSALPAGHNAVFSAGAGNTSGTLTWTPATGHARPAPYDVIFTASNALSGSATTSITVAGGGSGTNLVGNPSFETSTSGWSGNGGATLQRVAGGIDGSFSLEARAPATGTVKFGANDSPNWVTATPAVGARYRFTAWVRSATAAGLGELRVREYMVGVQQGATAYSPAVTLAPAWQMVTVDYSATVAGSTLDLQVLDEPIVPGEVFQTDNISIRTVTGGAAAASPHRQTSSTSSLAPVLAPNPPNPDATLAFTTSRDGWVRVRIYDAQGRSVRTLLDEANVPAGRHAVLFDGRDASGKRLASGIYFYRLEAQEGSTRGRFVSVK